MSGDLLEAVVPVTSRQFFVSLEERHKASLLLMGKIPKRDFVFRVEDWPIPHAVIRGRRFPDDLAPLASPVLVPSAGDTVQFRLTTALSQRDTASPENRIVPLKCLYEDDWFERGAAWLTDKLAKHGAEVVGELEWRRIAYPFGRGTAQSLIFADAHGSILVRDEDLFAKAMEHGIGRYKAFGMGLISVLED